MRKWWLLTLGSDHNWNVRSEGVYQSLLLKIQKENNFFPSKMFKHISWPQDHLILFSFVPAPVAIYHQTWKGRKRLERWHVDFF